ncbi:MAG: hypothetical protein ACKVPX_02300 [Myxococcaceae bacterium]
MDSGYILGIDQKTAVSCTADKWRPADCVKQRRASKHLLQDHLHVDPRQPSFDERSVGAFANHPCNQGTADATSSLGLQRNFNQRDAEAARIGAVKLNAADPQAIPHGGEAGQVIGGPDFLKVEGTSLQTGRPQLGQRASRSDCVHFRVSPRCEQVIGPN